MRKRIQTLTGLIILITSIGLNAQITVVNDGILTAKEGQLIHINGNLANYSPLLLNDGDFRLTGNFLNEVSVTNPGTGIFRFIGFEEQKLSILDTLRMFDIDIDNPSGLAFDGVAHLEVFGNINFIDGNANTTDESMLHFQTSASTANADSFSHINGPALKFGTTDFVFPLGKEGFYRPATISALTSPSTYRMEYFHETYFNEVKQFEVLKVNDEGYWDVQRTNGTSNPKLTLNYDPTSNMFSNTENLQIIHWDDLWKLVPSESDGAAPISGVITQNRLSVYGLFTTAEAEIVHPSIEFITIYQDKECEIQIDWVMPPGTMVEGYELEYSYDSLDFSLLGYVPGNIVPLLGYTSYQFIDENLHDVPKIYYRIKMTAPSPSTYSTYSKVVSIDNKCIFEDCLLYPNPVQANENLQFQVSAEVSTDMPLQIWDVIGRLMFEQTLQLKKGRHIYEIKTKDYRLASGTYLLRVTPKKSLKFIVINH